jgi:hypothetical protein
VDHAAIVRPFLSTHARATFANIEPDSKKRAKLLHRLCHRYQSVLDWRLAHPIPPAEQTVDAITAQLRRLGAGETCYALSNSDEWDGRHVNLRAALDALVGTGLPVLLVISEYLAYFEPEYEQGAGQRFVLQRRRGS